MAAPGCPLATSSSFGFLGALPAPAGAHAPAGILAADFMDRPLLESPLVFFDVETTGLSSRRGDRVCEIAVLRREPGGAEERFSALIDPGRSLSPGAFRVNRISREMLRAAPKFNEIAPRLRALLSGAIGVAHHATFDVTFIRDEYLRIGEPFVLPHCVDTLKWARAFYRLPKNNLGEVARAFGVEAPLAHRAMVDVETTRAIFLAMAGELSARGLATPREIQQATRKSARGRRKSAAA
jgi:DNA polymerase III epsilon subunit family exonuclease